MARAWARSVRKVVGRVGDEHLMSEPRRGVEQRELGTGVWTFGLHGRGPVFFLDQHEGIRHGGVDRQTDREPHVPVDAAVDEAVGRPAVSVRTSISVVSAGVTGNWASAASNTAR